MAESTLEHHGIDTQNRPPTYPDIARRPEVSAAMVKGSQKALRRSLEKPRAAAAADEIKEVSREVKRRLHDQFPDNSEQVEALLDITLPLARLKKETMLNTNTENPYEKEESARLQHALVHQILEATENDNEMYIATVYEVTRNTALMAEGLHNYGSNVGRLWKGMRNELAIIKTLEDHDYNIIIPNYNQDTTEITDEKNEVLQLDIKSGIDFIAVSPDGKILLIDAKGRISHQEVSEEMKAGRPKKIDTLRGINPLVVETLEEVAQNYDADLNQIYRMKVILPTEGRNFEPTDFSTHDHKDVEHQRSSLQRFATVKPEIAAGIMYQVQS